MVIDHVGFSPAFFSLTLLALATWIWIYPLTDRLAKRSERSERVQTAWHLWRNARFRRFMIVSVLLAACWDTHTFALPVMGHERGLPASIIGMILGATAISVALIRLVLPKIAAHVPEWALISGAMLMSAVLFGIYPFLPVAAAMASCSVLLGIAMGSVQPMVMSTMHRIVPDHWQGHAIAMRLMATSLSSLAMPMVFGAAGSLFGVKAVFWIMGAAVGCGSRFAFQLREVRRFMT